MLLVSLMLGAGLWGCLEMKECITEGQKNGRTSGSQTTPCNVIGAAEVADNAGEMGIRVDDGVLRADVLFSGRHDVWSSDGDG